MVGRNELDVKWALWRMAAKTFPDFDPNWPPEQQEWWYKSYRLIVKSAIHYAKCEDELERKALEGANS